MGFFYYFPYLLFKSVLGIRRDLDVSLEVPITLRIFNFMFCFMG